MRFPLVATKLHQHIIAIAAWLIFVSFATTTLIQQTDITHIQNQSDAPMLHGNSTIPGHWFDEQFSKSMPKEEIKSVKHGEGGGYLSMRSVGPEEATLVTAYFPLNKSKHSLAEYDTWMANTLSVQDSMVIFTPQRLVEPLQKLRAHALNRTRIVTLELIDTVLAKSRPEPFWELQHRLDPEKRIHNKYLYWIWGEKVQCLNQAMEMNYFRKSSFFFWIDMGYFRGDKYNGRRILRHIPTELQAGQMLFLDIGDRDSVGGGFFGGHSDAIAKFHHQYYIDLRADLDKKNIFVGKEQPRFKETCRKTSCMLIQPTGKYGNPWFHLARFLHHGE